MTLKQRRVSKQPLIRIARSCIPICVALLPWSAHSNNSTGPLEALKRMSFEELMTVEITSVSRTEETLRDAAAAIAVVSPEIIRRSGATTLPDALRLVPGIHVGQQTSSSWAVSARGFSSITSEKLLVLSDTRSIYTPLFSGVNWNVQDYLLGDVERVEVIRGPGAALWGSNAVNGVINITTRSSRDTHGTHIQAGAGSFDRAWFEARYGGETADGVNYRVYGKYFDRDATLAPGLSTEDSWNLGHVGFRTDWDGTPRDSFTVQGDAYQADVGQLASAINIIGRPGPEPPLNVDLSGGNVLARWRRSGDDGAEMQLRAYYDYTRRDDPSFLDTLHTFDIDLQRRFNAGSRHEILWGAAYRLTANTNRSRVVFAVEPEDSNDQLFSGFIQDHITLGQKLRLTLGTKLEHNDFSGFEVQPSVRMAWSPRDNHTVWVAISRAVRVPTRLERDIAIDITNPAGNPVARLLGNDEYGSERLTAYELGDRWQPIDKLSFDLALFYNDYDRLASLEIGEPFVDTDGRTVIPVINENLTRGRTYGAELLVEWQPVDDWRLSASYSHIEMSLTPGGADLNRGEWLEDATPRDIAGLRSLFALGTRVELDAQLRYQTSIVRQPMLVTGESLDGYTELDVRLGWNATPHWDLSVVGQNLLHDEHVEFGPPDRRGALERAAYLRATWRN
ncbi:MAG TPA: TonB-dependent receptor [Steroidobacteraceae bacterium]|nr:TonB-dependent receptor [Steroidobacteraceae bacterium]